jgi:signal transduction histidine kinase
VKRSIRIRLLVWILALLVPLTAGAAWLLVELFGNRLLHDIDVALEEEAETVAAVLEKPAPPGEVETLVRHLASERDLGMGKAVAVRRDGRLIAEAPPGASEQLASNDPKLRVLHYEGGTKANPVSIAIGVRPAHALAAERRLRLLLTAGVPLTLLAISAGLWIVIGRALAPLEGASRSLEAIGLDNLSARLDVVNPEDEVGRMVTVLNRMLARLQGAVSELQRFTADAAHELRTPLTVLHTGLEVALSRERSAQEYREELRQALAATDRIRHLAEELLTQARLEVLGQPADVGLVDLSEVLHDLTEAWAQVAERDEIELTVNAVSPLEVRGNADDLYRLFNNLIDNALRHSPRGGRVVLTAQRVANGVEATVEDGGPGVRPEDGARSATGTGLGLSIAQKIARMHGGLITLRNREGGGCVARVTLSQR